MNVKEQPTLNHFKFAWKKIAAIAIVLLIGGYQWYTQNNSDDKPALVETGTSGPSADESRGLKPATSKGGNTDPRKTSNATPGFPTVGPYLEPAGGKNLKSPAGLIYTGGQSEHRSEHVLHHANDIPDRDGPHGVFDADGDDVFRLVDEAYELIKHHSPQVKKTPAESGKTEYVIDMKRKIGFLGGKTGIQKNNPPLHKIKLILADNRVITAYPY